MSIQTIIDILDTYRSAGQDEVVVHISVVDAMVEHLEKLDAPQTDMEQFMEAYGKLETLALTCPDEGLRPLIDQFVNDVLPHVIKYKL